MPRTALGKLMEHWHPDKAIAFGQLLRDIPFGEQSWTVFGNSYNQRINMPRNPFNQLRQLIQRQSAGEEKMAHDIAYGASTAAGMVVKLRTFREQMQDQIAYHKAKIADLEGVLNSMTPEVEKFVEALQKANL